jgi:Fungal Zn(2)-Cys(6) binuclear cluster domain
MNSSDSKVEKKKKQSRKFKFVPRGFTACDACREQKRKCDLSKLGHFPCSSCTMRNIGSECKITGSEVQRLELTTLNDGVSGSTHSHSRHLPMASTTGLSGHEDPLVSDLLTVEMLTEIVSGFFENDEWSFFCDRQTIVRFALTSRLPQPEGIDLPSLALLYGICCSTVHRRGIRCYYAGRTSLTSVEIARKYFDLHMTALKGMPHHPGDSLTCLQAYIMTTHCYLHFEDTDNAWKSFYVAVECYNQLTERMEHIQDNSKELQSAFVALCVAEMGLTLHTEKEAIFYSGNIGEFKDLRLRRRMIVVDVFHKAQKTFARGEPLEPGLMEEIKQTIVRVNEWEGRALPFGQISLFTLLVKIETYKLAHTHPSNLIVRAKAISDLITYGNSLSTCLQYLESHEARPLLVSSPWLAVQVFQSLTCVWLQYIKCHEDEVSAPHLERCKESFGTFLNKIKDDASACRRTMVLFKCIEILERAHVDELGNLIQVPVQLRSGMSSLYEKWTKSRLVRTGTKSLGKNVKQISTTNNHANDQPNAQNNESWVSINPSVDELDLWTMVAEDVQASELFEPYKNGFVHSDDNERGPSFIIE